MSALKTKPARTLLVIALALAGVSLSGCGKSSNGNAVAQAQGIDPRTGLPIGGGAIGSGGCIPITQAVQTGIPVVMQNIYMDSANIVGGMIPNSSQQVGAIGFGGGNAYGMYQRTSPYGTIRLDLNQIGAYNGMPYSGYPSQSMWNQSGSYAWGNTGQYPYGYNNYNQGNQMVSGQGIITVSSTAMQAILYKVMSGEIQINVNPQVVMQQPQAVCVSAVAINVGHYNNLIYGGNVYLYLNGTSRGYILQF